MCIRYLTRYLLLGLLACVPSLFAQQPTLTLYNNVDQDVTVEVGFFCDPKGDQTDCTKTLSLLANKGARINFPSKPSGFRYVFRPVDYIRASALGQKPAQRRSPLGPSDESVVYIIHANNKELAIYNFIQAG